MTPFIVFQPETEGVTHRAPKYGCRDADLAGFWERLDKEQFLRQQKAWLRYWNEGDPQLFRRDWEKFESEFNCSFFWGVTSEDLNSDGFSELRVAGSADMHNVSEFVFRDTQNGLEMILANIGNIESEVEKTSVRGFRNMTYITNWSGGGRVVTHYRFDGRKYRPKHCFSEDHFFERNGEVFESESPITKRITCDARNFVTS